jgi:hypothetical protein
VKRRGAIRDEYRLDNSIIAALILIVVGLAMLLASRISDHAEGQFQGSA